MKNFVYMRRTRLTTKTYSIY